MQSANSSPANVRAPDGALPIALAVASIVATIAFWAYTRTLLPGVDLGDTGGFQAALLWPETSARQSYPLYYALARPFVVTLSSVNPARGLNLFSAVCAAAAAGLLTLVASVVTRSVLAGAAAGLLLAFSYTFWTQAIIAEVYALHLALIGLCLAALQGFAARPTTMRLAIFFAVYALSFGNHLSMILLLLPFAVFILHVHPHPRELFRPAIVALALAAAAAGALQYTPNFLSVWSNVDAQARWADRVAAFWFDVTKADWRETMVAGVSRDQLADRLAMWWWDSRQQFGVAGLALAGLGAMRLWSLSRPWAVFVWLAYAVSTLFALSYNVGDTHVFFLPGHFLTALAAAAAVAPWSRQVRWQWERRRLVGIGSLATLAVLVYAAWRGWDTFPVADRHQDRRADALVARVGAGINERNAVLLSTMDWQAENALLYAARYERPDLAWTRLAEVLPHLPYLVRDNHAIGRDVVLTAKAAVDVVTAFGPLFPMRQDAVPAARSLTEIVADIPPGTPYVLSLLTPPADDPLDAADLASAVRTLAGGQAAVRSGAAYQVWAGTAGDRPTVELSSNRPFRRRFHLHGEPFTVRLDSWLPFDTFRRGGFGHVLRGRQHGLFIERGVSLVWFRPDGSPASTYAAGLYAPEPRFRISAPVAYLARFVR
jgi:hypothetical protein